MRGSFRWRWCKGAWLKSARWEASEAETETPDYDGRIKAPPSFGAYVVVVAGPFAPSLFACGWRFVEKVASFQLDNRRRRRSSEWWHSS